MQISPQARLIYQRTLPLTLGVLAIMAVQLVDTIFIGYLGVEAISAQGITMPFASMMISIQVGLGVAATSLISRYVGQGKYQRARRTATVLLLLGAVIMASLAIGLGVARDVVFDLFVDAGVADIQRLKIEQQFNAYWWMWLFSAFCSAMMYLVSSVYRANQDSRSAGKMLIQSSLINAVLDPIFIFVLDFGITGAAMASSTAFIVCSVQMMANPKVRPWFAAISAQSETWQDVRAFINDAAATTTNQFLPAVSAFLSMYFIAKIGPDAVAVWGIAMRMEGLLLVTSLSLTMSIPPIVGHYLGSGQTSNIRRLVSSVIKIVLSMHVIFALVVGLLSPLIVDGIGKGLGLDSELQFVLLVMPLSYATLGLCMVMVSLFNALAKPKRALHVSFVRLFVLFIPAVYIGTLSGSITDVVIAAACANFMAGGYAWLTMRRQLKLFPDTTDAPDLATG